MFEKERMFLHFQRFQNFRSAVFSFFATNFHLFFPTMPFETPIFLAYELSIRQGKPPLYFVACYYAQYRMRCAILRNHLKTSWTIQFKHLSFASRNYYNGTPVQISIEIILLLTSRRKSKSCSHDTANATFPVFKSEQ